MNKKVLNAYRVAVNTPPITTDREAFDLLKRYEILERNGYYYRFENGVLEFTYKGEWVESTLLSETHVVYKWNLAEVDYPLPGISTIATEPNQEEGRFDASINIEIPDLHSMDKDGKTLALGAIDTLIEKLNQNITFNQPHYVRYLKDVSEVEALQRAKADIMSIPIRKEIDDGKKEG